MTAEAAAFLAIARLLVSTCEFRRWRGLLGRPVAAEPGDPTLCLDHNLGARRLARAVARAAGRFPGESRCFPQAVALGWMLRRRGLAYELVLGVMPKRLRGGLDDLHAWVVREREILIGADGGRHRPFAAFSPRS